MAAFDQEQRQQEGPWSHPVCGYLVAFLLPVAAITVMALLGQGFPSFRFQGELVMLVVLLVSLNWGLGPGVITTFVGTALLLFVPLSSFVSLGVLHPADVPGVCLSLGSGLTVSVLTSHMQRARRHADVVLREVTQRRQLEQRTRTLLHTLLTMAEALVQAPDTGKAGNHQPSLPTREVAQHLGDLTRNVLDCQAATIIALEPHTDRMSPVASSGFSPHQERLFGTTIQGSCLSERLSDPCNGYLGHPFKNLPIENEKDPPRAIASKF
jgi:K+-sensing histidine kinase KdpD